jgi:hypothetical protein
MCHGLQRTRNWAILDVLHVPGTAAAAALVMADIVRAYQHGVCHLAEIYWYQFLCYYAGCMRQVASGWHCLQLQRMQTLLLLQQKRQRWNSRQHQQQKQTHVQHLIAAAAALAKDKAAAA